MKIKNYIEQRPAFSFFLLTYLWTWIMWAAFYFSFPSYSTSPGKDISPLFLIFFFFAGISPSLIGIILTKITEGDTSSLVQRLRFSKENISWYLFPLLLPYCIVVLAYLLNRSAGDNFSINLLAILPNLLTGLSAGLIEEFGWRGFALPRLQKKHNPLIASIILGFFWGLWYLVGSYWAVGSSFGKIFPIYFIVSAVVPMISYSILMTWLFNKTKSNLVFAILFHTAISASVSTFLPLSGDTKADTLMYLIYAVIISVTAFVFVFADPKMFKKASN